ncbi:universal stress protein [Comamonas testosteroni]|uniref:Universal stress protein n=1 Tax=Comamonas testosteroni TaxID=285 RepID=A0A373FQW1_COMTE|nr:universal stress protein [Comamonas testosteroni]RGE46516.1 universal stress protein [Comamonas testosteroni]
MNPIIVYVDDAAYAQPMLEALAGSSQAASSHWLLVACAPRMTHRVSKWVSHRARENWRGKWADKLFAAVVPVMTASGAKVTPVLAKGPLTELVAELQQEHGAAQIIDARRPKQEAVQVATAKPGAQTAPMGNRWNLPGTMAAIAAMMGFVIEDSLSF